MLTAGFIFNYVQEILFMDSLIPAAMGQTRQSGCGVVTFLQLDQAGWLHCYQWAWLKFEIDIFPGYLADGIGH